MTHGTLRTFEIEAGQAKTVFYLPEAKYIKPLLLGQETFLADLIWIRTLGYFADQLRGGKFEYLEGLINLATDLDPRFEQIYMWAGAIYMYRGGRISKKQILASTKILEKGWRRIQEDPVGWKHHPQYWMIPQMIGFNYAVELRDREKGAPYMAATARIPGSPEIYKTYAATNYQKAGKLEEGIKVLEDMLAIETLESQLKNIKQSSLQERIRVRLGFYYQKLYGPEEAKRRLIELERSFWVLVSEWREDFAFIRFDLFLLLRDPETEWEKEERTATWSAAFPALSYIHTE